MSHHPTATDMARIKFLVERIECCNKIIEELRDRTDEKSRSELANNEAQKSSFILELRSLVNKLTYVPHEAVAALR
uniref:AsIV-cont00005-ORF1 n=1 Tax=Apophua simplicipes ichnovirus TaxID=1329648 RepID=S5DMF2_9VIRU|nr:AsIV-cont00005-ORF1 [Apophua simplicipes ichnovirus]